MPRDLLYVHAVVCVRSKPCQIWQRKPRLPQGTDRRLPGRDLLIGSFRVKKLPPNDQGTIAETRTRNKGRSTPRNRPPSGRDCVSNVYDKCRRDASTLRAKIGARQ
ncbi:hypothetical protein LSAT2_008998 [Lamellibrachia satsuma]|nr:hypothetical protein LSAT2_008998 [Lamellibrachia satsuma]